MTFQMLNSEFRMSRKQIHVPHYSKKWNRYGIIWMIPKENYTHMNENSCSQASPKKILDNQMFGINALALVEG